MFEWQVFENKVKETIRNTPENEWKKDMYWQGSEDSDYGDVYCVKADFGFALKIIYPDKISYGYKPYEGHMPKVIYSVSSV